MLVALVVVATALLGCGDPEEAAGSGETSAGDADAVVAAAVEDVLSDGPFRSRTTGQLPFVSEMDAVYEQSGDDVVDISISDGVGSATVIAGGIAYEWDAASQSWTETPLDSFDPLLGPGFLYGLSLLGLLDAFDGPSTGGGSDEAGWAPELPPVATGWTEVDRGADGTRRFERTLPPTLFAEQSGSSEGVPVERLEEDAIINEFFRSAEVTSSVELDRDDNLVRNVVRVVFDGSEDYPSCAPLDRRVGTTEMVVEFNDVATEFTIAVPDPAELVADFPLLAEPPDYSELDTAPIDGAFRDESGERDLSGCPGPQPRN